MLETLACGPITCQAVCLWCSQAEPPPNVTLPVVTPCLQQTLLCWVPCGFVFLAGSVYLYLLLRAPPRRIPHNWLNISKTVSTLGSPDAYAMLKYYKSIFSLMVKYGMVKYCRLNVQNGEVVRQPGVFVGEVWLMCCCMSGAGGGPGGTGSGRPLLLGQGQTRRNGCLPLRSRGLRSHCPGFCK